MQTANIAVAQTRATAVTANLYARGQHVESVAQNHQWSDFMEKNFVEEKYQRKQEMFTEKNRKLNRAIHNKVQKKEAPKKKEASMIAEEEM